MADAATEIDRLCGLISADYWRLLAYDGYYEGKQPIRFLAPAMRREFGDRITPLVINLPRFGTDAYENRLDVEGFRYSKDDSRDEDLWAIWQASNGDEKSQQAHLESLALSRSYVWVGAPKNADDPPLITAESPFQAYVDRDPATGEGRSGIKWFTEYDGTRFATLLLPDSTGHYRWKDGWVLDRPVDEHGLGKVAMVPLVNRPRLLYPNGVSEFHDIIPLTDALNKIATDMMTSAEYHAMPRRYVFGIKASDFEDDAGNPVDSWQAIAGRLWALEGNGEDNDGRKIQVGQFPEADLANFHNTIRLLIQVANQTLALPPHYLGFTGENPTSADAIRSSEAQLVKRAMRKQTFLGGAWEEVMRIALRIQTGVWDRRAWSLETMWRDPSTPTVAQKADAVLKLVQAGVLPIEQAREDLGYTPEQRRRMADMDDRAAVDQNVATIARTFQAGATPAVTNASAAGN